MSDTEILVDLVASLRLFIGTGLSEMSAAQIAQYHDIFRDVPHHLGAAIMNAQAKKVRGMVERPNG